MRHILLLALYINDRQDDRLSTWCRIAARSLNLWEDFMAFVAIRRVIELGLRTAAYLEWLGPLLARLFVGCLFLLSGWSKVHKLAWFGAMFAGWGIPYPF